MIDHREYAAAITAVAVVGLWLVLASVYCYVHGVIETDNSSSLAHSMAWAFNQWGSWLALAPALTATAHRVWPYALRFVMLAALALTLSLLVKLSIDTLLAEQSPDIWRSAYLFAPRSLALLALVLAVEAARVHWLSNPTASSHKPILELKSGNGSKILIKKDNIRFARAVGNYVEIDDGVGLGTLRSTLQDLEKRLDPADFVRVHRSFLVNVDFVHRIERIPNSRRYRLRLKGVGPPIPISRRGLETVNRALKQSGLRPRV